MEPTVLSVGQYLSTVNSTLRQIDTESLVIEGEVSDFRIAQQKWVSFDLKDEEEEAVLKCFMTTWQLKVPLEDGMRVQVAGYPKIYERFGTFKLNVQQVALVGEGALRQAYELLKKKLEAEGFFDATRKRLLPRFPERIGLITSRDAAAYGDFMRILNNRWGGVEVQHAHVHVQGRQAVSEILGAFQYFNHLPEFERPDVLVLIRGGGGLEDLHAFNDEGVARAVFQSSIPVVCGVGHERDESLADFVADIRASTPSNAAERIVPSRQEVLYELSSMAHYLEDQIHRDLERKQHVLDRATRAVSYVLEREQERCKRLAESLMDSVEGWLPSIRDRVEQAGRLLKTVDPKRVLSRGYSIVSVNGAVVTDIKQLDIGSEIGVQLGTGSVDAEVKRIGNKGQSKLL